ncbi:Fic/DOC family protein [Pseudomonas sp. RIT288]|uniref:Fic/DOC family protein n=1 Tax=Pseudomonas sp. RIT288 TaxID=1470589 RepID=UPI0006459FE0|nr:Fic family protein [Pseudomonas sp. RIT288]
MSTDKYGTDQAPDCYPGTDVLINLLNLQNAQDLDEAERYINEVAAETLDFILPPYSLATLKQIHRTLFERVYSWAGEIRSLAISKGTTRFCSPEFIEREVAKEFERIEAANWFEGYRRDQLVVSVAESYGTLNVAHPFREGNGRTQRILFEYIIVNAGYSIDWSSIGRQEWIDACIHSFYTSDQPLADIFDRCVGTSLVELDY